jgi:YidC/Oxa1 family membrane protein insertase
MGVAMVFQQRMSTVDTQNKQAQMMMKIMPIMFTAFMLFLPSGLVLYYALSLIIGVGQQYFIRKKFDAEPEPAAS